MQRLSTSHARARPLEGNRVAGGWRTWLCALLAAGAWFEVLWAAAPTTVAGSMPPALAAAAGLAAQLAFTAIEASLGVAAWAALGTRVRWSALAPALLVVSIAEATAVALASGALSLPDPWRVFLAGPRAVPELTPPGAAARAFTGFGALAVLRLALATQAHAAAARVPWWKAAALVLAFYLASRLVVWWSLDLLQGRSYEAWSLLAPSPNAGTG
jgi:hypothetical protein